ncbi:MAG: malto-oligosyltrehalose trehalohydrolase, partial [Lysobacterales bacterium]
MSSVHAMPFGAAVTPEACGTRFAIWAPSAHGAHVEVDGRRLPMEPVDGGFFHCFDSHAAPGSRYAFRFDVADF